MILTLPMMGNQRKDIGTMTRDNGTLAVDRAADDGSWRIGAYRQDKVPTFSQAWAAAELDFEEPLSPFVRRARMGLLPVKVIA